MTLRVPEAAVTARRYRPSGSAPADQTNVLLPAMRCSSSTEPSAAPLASNTPAVTSAGPPSVKPTVVIPPVPSAAGAITDGLAARFVSDSGAAGGGADLPIAPVATRIPGAEIVQV